MDSMAEINSPVDEAEELELPANHPGINDKDYVRRRKLFFYLARDLRLRGLAPPIFPYTEQECALWEATYKRLEQLHQKVACSLYLEGKQALPLSSEQVPQLVEVERALISRAGVRLVPAEGLLHGKTYFRYWSERIMPVTLFLRFPDCPDYTPEPDMIHDIIGHVPPLVDKKYVELIQLLGKIANIASPDQLDALVRFYWYTVEFGLVREAGSIKVLGAGILSSVEELENMVAERIEIRSFNFEEVLQTPIDTVHQQEFLFLADSLEQIIDYGMRLYSPPT